MAAKGTETRIATGDADTYIVKSGLEKATSHPRVAMMGMGRWDFNGFQTRVKWFKVRRRKEEGGKFLPALNVRYLKSEKLPIIFTYKDKENCSGAKVRNFFREDASYFCLECCKRFRTSDKAEILCFDTFSSNSGLINDVITFLEQYERPGMVYFPFWQHMYEFIKRSVLEYELSQVTSNPDVVFFKKSEKN
ncbi:hypothetical protein AVEN_92201-1 [Araneus ventricosus]|uniref:Uncharacterized protein n=1 Tax=Araneus ventricosus TaxID=182803 RepID=A0A4Y2AKU3_ARAVE|nr:hypothetical protein AVEN_92201-1 [Araneus ventricosus]